jgi:putative ABC transport system permease protein
MNDRRSLPSLLVLVEALRGLARYPLRTALSLAGLTVGVASVVGTLALLDGSRRLSTTFLAREGSLDLIRMESPGHIHRAGRRIDVTKRVPLGPADAARFRATIPELRAVSAVIEMQRAVRRGSVSVDATVDGSEATLPDLYPVETTSGRFLLREEVERADRVVVLSEGLAADLFPDRAAIGEEVAIRDQRFVVVGLARLPKGDSGNEPMFAWVPFRTAIERLGAVPEDANLLLASGSLTKLEDVRASVERLAGHLRPGVPSENFEVESRQEELDDVTRQASMQATILGGVALLSILAAGTGILNTLLVGVRERTREIGTRRALGARRGTILRQFLAEAFVLSVPGALAGVTVGVLVARWLGAILAAGLEDPSLLRVSVGPREALLGALAAVAVATVAGIWPAWQAARIPPAEALRYE